MSIKSVNYSSNCKLSCGCGDRVILCVSDTITVSGLSFIDGVLANVSSSYDTCGAMLYNYSVTYEGDLLVVGEQDLVACDISGMVCRGCMTQYIDDAIAYAAANWSLNGEPHWYFDGSSNFLPDVDSAYDIGSPTLRVQDIYARDFNVAWQYHYQSRNATDTANVGLLSLNNFSNTELNVENGHAIDFAWAGVTKWQMNAGYDLVPGPLDTLNIGNLTNRLLSVYTNGVNLQNGTYLVGRNFNNLGDTPLVRLDTGDRTNINTGAGKEMYFLQNGIAKWEFDANFNLLPMFNAAFDIGALTYRVRTVLARDLNISNAHSLAGRDFADVTNIPLVGIDASNNTLVNAAPGASIYFQANGAGVWLFDTSSNFRPVTSSTKDIGTLTYRVRTVLADDLNISNAHSLAGRDFAGVNNVPLIGIDASNNTFVNASSGASLYFQANGTGVWLFDPSFNLRPVTDSSSDIGTLAYRVRDVFTGNIRLKSTGAVVGRDHLNAVSTNLLYTNGSDDTLLNAKAGQSIFFQQGGSGVWLIDPTGNLLPSVTATYEIGNVGSRVHSIYANTVRLSNNTAFYSMDQAGAVETALLYQNSSDNTILNAKNTKKISMGTNLVSRFEIMDTSPFYNFAEAGAATASAGGGQAALATVSGYINVLVAGVAKKIPYFSV